MKLHKILMRHCGPKDCVEVTKLYVIADSEELIFKKLDADFNYGKWKDQNEDSDEEYTIYDDDSNAIGTENYMERMLRLRGEFNDEDADYSDAYYGVTHYGWDEGLDVSEDDIKTLLRLGVAQDWRAST